MKIAIIDVLGLTYDGSTVDKRGLGGSESAVVYMSRELAKLGFNVTVFNSCIDGNTSPGVYDQVLYVDHSEFDIEIHNNYDIVISSRSVGPWLSHDQYVGIASTAKHKVLWMHDTFCQFDEMLEDMLIGGYIDEVFTLSDFHSWYFTSADHGHRRNFEVLKHKFYQTRNGAKRHIPIDQIDLRQKDPNRFVYNASATKGLIPLVKHIWPMIKQVKPEAKLTCIGGYYRFREGHPPDEQELMVKELIEDPKNKDLDITFTGVIPQKDIARILADATLMLYPTAFPETFGISSLESLLYKTPIVTNVFGALEETAVDMACYKIPYSSTNNALFNNINEDQQAQIFVNTFLDAINDPYLLQQKQNYCEIVDNVAGWDTVAKQWRQHFYYKMKKPLGVEEFREVNRINQKVARVFNRRFNNEEERIQRYTNDKQQKIIIISPFYNAENYIDKCIESVAQQDYDKYLHILIDDASTDDSLKVARETIKSLNMKDKSKFLVIENKTNKGAIRNQIEAMEKFCDRSNIVMLLDGDDWLVNNNTIFTMYNDLYQETKTEFTYGSCWSIADNIPLIAQEYPDHIKRNKDFENHKFNWGIPYTHLRTHRGHLGLGLDHDLFKDENGEWMKAGADAPLFYEMIKKAHNPISVKDIVCNYNDANPINDFRIRGEEQNKNAGLKKTGMSNTIEKINKPTKESLMKKILIAVPTNKYVETDTMKSIYDLDVPVGYSTELQFFYGYRIDQVRNLIADWGRHYDYVLHVDSDIILPKDALVKMLTKNKDIISGLYIQRKEGEHVLEAYNEKGNMQYSYFEEKEFKLQQVRAVGFGCCLVKSDVLRRMDYPHFVYQSAIDHSNTVSEDWYFCNKAGDLGFETWVDPTIQCNHVGSTTFEVGAVNLKIAEHATRKSNLQKIAEQDLLPEIHVEYLHKMKDLGVKPKVIYDIGACVLHWTRKAKDVWPDAEYYLMDAAEAVRPFLKNSGHQYHIGAMSKTDDQKIKFYEDPENPGGNSYYKENTDHFTEDHARIANTITLDTLIERNNWPQPDLIKMDIQGAELDVLMGATKTLKHATDIILEAQHENYNEGAPHINEIVAWMRRNGWKLVSNFCRGKVDGDYHFVKV